MAAEKAGPRVTRLLGWARSMFGPEETSRVFEPLLADWQHERLTAEGRAARVMATIRGAATFLSVACLMLPRRLCAPIPLHVVIGALKGSTLYCVPVTLLLMLPAFSQLPGAGLLSFAYLLPSAAALTLPFSMVIIVDYIRRDGRTSDYEKPRLVAQFALLGAFVMLVTLGWIVPHANQDFREAIASTHGFIPARGPRELTLIELFSASPAATAEIWNRFLLIGLPLFYAAVRWILLPLIARFVTGRVLSQAVWFLGTMLTFSFFRLTGFTAGLARGPYPAGYEGMFGVLLGMAIIASALPQRQRRRDQSIARSTDQ